ncbi:M23 family metallopeptidase [Tomitella fengzijianii]|uniref:M23 family metallopeptidase n=1 Tax=Tomitella fengzijianii TaxID=2597660 RepID=UPI001E2B30E0|nr:peptidoglycan DD-metalloendopeptidase family protein [Tomitella fengzijianii]
MTGTHTRGAARLRAAGRIAAALCITAACAAPAVGLPSGRGGPGTGTSAPPVVSAEPAPGSGAFAPERRERAQTSRYDWPLPRIPEVTRGFDKPEFRYAPGHRGVDLAAAPGAPVLAAGPGVVAFAGPVAGRGVVSIDHPSGLRTTYEPLTPTVGAGDTVITGTIIGRLSAGHAGCPRAACLHWGLRDGSDDYRDPRSLLGTITIRLLPV